LSETFVLSRAPNDERSEEDAVIVIRASGDDFVDTKTIVSAMKLAARQGGVVAKALQDSAVNVSKVSGDDLPGDTDLIRAQRAAKTAIDDIVQEIVLLAAMEYSDPGATALDAEEDTLSVKRFAAGAGEWTLVVDPIDGTLEYVGGKDSFSISVGLLRGERLWAAVVYFPRRDSLYSFDASEGVTVSLGSLPSRPWPEMEAKAPRTIYVNSRVPEDLRERLRAQGFNVFLDGELDGGCLTACLRLFEGRATAYLCSRRQARDILLGGIFGGCRGASAVDWDGKPLAWSRGRIERAMFCVGPPSPELLQAIRGS
jgi:fructose-1,6-bisphosphatase/inositol monophosphatase family enzyme